MRLPRLPFLFAIFGNFEPALLLSACLIEFTFRTHCHHQEGKNLENKGGLLSVTAETSSPQGPGNTRKGISGNRSQSSESMPGKALYKTASNKTTKGMHVLHLSYIIYEQL